MNIGKCFLFAFVLFGTGLLGAAAPTPPCCSFAPEDAAWFYYGIYQTQFNLAAGSFSFETSIWSLAGICDEDEGLYSVVNFSPTGPLAKGVTFSSNGRYLLFACRGCTIKVLDLSNVDGLKFFMDGGMFTQSGIEGMTSFKGGRFDLVAIDGNNFIAAECVRRSITLWDFRNNKRVFLSKCDCDVNSMLFSKDGGILAVGYKNGTIKLWNVATKALIDEFNFNKCLDAMAFNNKGDCLAICGDGGIELWNVALMNRVKLVGSHIRTNCLRFSADDKGLIFRESGKSLAFYSIENERCNGVYRLNEHDPRDGFVEGKFSVNDIAVSPDGLCVAVLNPAWGELILLVDAYALKARRKGNFAVSPWVDVFKLQQQNVS